MIHLDTNFLIHALTPKSAAEEKLQTWLRDQQELGISSIAWSEFLCGPLTQPDEALAQVLFPTPEPFLVSDAHKAAQLFQCDWPSLTQSGGLPNCRSCVAVQRPIGNKQYCGLWRISSLWIGARVTCFSSRSF
jgi:hypothetical protein